MLQNILLLPVRGLAGLVRAVLLIAAGFAAIPAGAQTPPQEAPQGEIYIAPDHHGYEMKLENRKKIVCAARRDAYDQQHCDKACTDSCKSIGAELRECEARAVSCVR